MPIQHPVYLKALVLALMTAFSQSAAFAANDGAQGKMPSPQAGPSASLPDVVVIGHQNSDIAGKERVYTKDISNYFLNKEEVERYKGISAADILMGISGVYSSDARNSGAVSPNIRGIQGQGRIPVVVDGTQQEITVYRGYAGVNNRNYVDPNLLRSVSVYKGPSLDRNIPNGMGGAIVMETIDATDVIPEGKNFGVSLLLEGSTNAVKPRVPHHNNGKDYRTVEYGWLYQLRDANPRLLSPIATSGQNTFFKDAHAARIAVGYKYKDLTDIMLAYSYRDQGNYFAGNKGADFFKSHGHLKARYDTYKGFIADLYPENSEVMNTSSKNRSFLLKNNWYLPNQQKIKFSWRHSDIQHGEIMNSRISYGLMLSNVLGQVKRLGSQWPLSKIKQDAYRLDYEWHPENNRWINLKAGVWATRTNTRTMSSGSSPALPYNSDALFNQIVQDMCNKQNPDTVMGLNPDCYLTPEQVQEALKRAGNKPNTNGRYNLYNPALHVSQNNRWGVDVSNRMQLLPSLGLTLGGEFQRETLRGSMGPKPRWCYEKYCDDDPYVFDPKSGKRQEHNLWFSFDWQPTERLNISAGGRWASYWSYDAGLDKLVRARDPGVADRKEQLVWQGIEVSRVLHRNQPRDDWEKEFWQKFDVSRNTADEFAKGKYVGGAGSVIDFGLDKNKITVRGYKKWHARNGKLYAADRPDLEPGEVFENIFDGSLDGVEYKNLTDAERWAAVEKRRGRAFSPAFSVSYTLGDNARIYARYTEAARMPSIFEDTVGFSASARRFPTLQPEKSRNLELGYVHNLTALLPSAQHADVKLNYYRNRIYNVIDREANYYSFTQYDKMKVEGLELQARYDNGTVFGDLGVAHNIKTEVCDVNQAVMRAPYNKNIPICWAGGFPGGYLRATLPPKYTVTTNLGVRLFNDKLTLGGRAIYNTASDSKKQQQDAARAGIAEENSATTPIYWKPFWLFDAYVDYRINKHAKLSLTGSNLTNRYYTDTLTRTFMPAPGRTVKLSLEAKF